MDADEHFVRLTDERFPPRDPGLNGWLVVLERLLAVLFITMVLVLLVAQVYFRYVAQDPLLWSDEAARISLIYLTFIGAGLVASTDSHISMELIDTRLTNRGRRILRVLVNLAMVAASSVVIYTSIPTIQRAMTQYTTALEVQVAYLYAAGAIGFALIVLHSLRNVVRIIRGQIDVGAPDPMSLLP